MALSNPPAAQPRNRRYGWAPCFEAEVCLLDGTRIRGTAYRQGRTFSGEARLYQFRFCTKATSSEEGNANLSRFEQVLGRLQALLRPQEIDLLYLIHAAGRSPAALARECKVHRGGIGRRMKRIIGVLRKDSILRALYDGTRRATT